MEDTLQMDEDDELEEEADAEVDKVLFDLTDGKLGQAGAARTELPVRQFRLLYPRVPDISFQPAEQQLDDEETERVMEQYRQQLNGLLSG